MAITPVIPSDNTYSLTATVPDESCVNKYLMISQLKIEKIMSAVKTTAVVIKIVFSFLLFFFL